MSFLPSQARQVELVYPEQKVLLAADTTGAWRVLEPKAETPDSNLVQQMLAALATMRATGFTDSLPAPDSLGFNPPQLVVRVTLQDGSTHALEVGRGIENNLFYCRIPGREQVFTLAYSTRDAAFLKRFTFGGFIMDKDYMCIPDKGKVLFLEPATPEQLYIRYKPAPYQKINQQTCNPSEVEVKGPKTRGRQISIKDVSSINSKPPRGWDHEGPTTKLQFA
jgi:hypothetical protein